MVQTSLGKENIQLNFECKSKLHRFVNEFRCKINYEETKKILIDVFLNLV